ncbi:hypothetical protein [Deinococcus radiophilus]|uniref:hypothetical protein n=1 Tax=Deinococcus radiophilus TaxID=32062 RepID=UPI003622E946
MLDPRLLPALHALMRGPLSVGDLAQECGLSGRRAYSLVQKLQRSGITQQVGTRPHRGRPVRLYQAAQPWLVPYAQTGAASVAEFFWQQHGGGLRQLVGKVAQASMQERDDWGYWLEAGRFEVGNRSGPVTDLWTGDAPQLLPLRELRLGDADAAEFKRRLNALLNEFEGRATPDMPPLALALTQGNWWATEEGQMSKRTNSSRSTAPK